MTPPTAEGGQLRSQDLRTSGDPVTLDGTIIRINPDTGAAIAVAGTGLGSANAAFSQLTYKMTTYVRTSTTQWLAMTTA